MQIERYTPNRKGEWDAFVRGSKNGTFLFERDYMDYHADRFEDHSLMVCDGDRLVAVLPAHQEGSRLASHNGLTYGGFVTQCSMGSGRMLDIFSDTVGYLQAGQFTSWLYKTIPHVYQSHPAEEDLYALWRHGARVLRSGVLAVVRPGAIKPQVRRIRGARAASEWGLKVVESADYDAFWDLLTMLLFKKYGTVPVHTLEEIERLAAAFPDHIRLFGCMDGREMIAGVVIYESQNVARTQYIAASDRGKELHALDAVFEHLLNQEYRHKAWLDMGTSDEDEGRTLNCGLLEYKESWGARAIAHNHYLLDLKEAA